MCNADKAGINATGTLYIYDVVQEWRRLSGLPAVLAVWAARSDSITPEVAADFAASKAYGVAHLEEIAEAAADELVWPPKNCSPTCGKISITR